MRIVSGPPLVRAAAAGILLALAACAPGEASPNPSPQQDRSRSTLMRGYSCTQGPLVGRYSCARSLQRQAQRAAAPRAAGACPSCGLALSR